MSFAVDQIMKFIRSLPSEEVDELLRLLQDEYVMPRDDHASTSAAWNAEIAERVKDVEDGRVQLISGEESDRRVEALFTKFGITPPTKN